MAAPTNKTFGAGFNADAFRDVIRSTMEMGLPNSVSERATFLWKPEVVYGGSTNHAGRPLDYNSKPSTVTERDPVQIPCAVEFIDRAPDGTPIANIQNPRVVISVMDVDYPQIEGADSVLLGGNTYKINYIAPPVGLFTFTLYQIHCQAVDES